MEVWLTSCSEAALCKETDLTPKTHKGTRGHPVHPLRRKFNSVIATLRYKVEQAFGTMKRRFHLARARYFGVAKTQAQMAWAALGMNLLKAHRLLQSGRLQPLAGSSPC